MLVGQQEDGQEPVDAPPLELESRSIRATLHWFHWLVLAMSLLVAVGAAHLSQTHVDDRIADDFQRQSDLILELVSERMRKYELGLSGGVSAIQANGGTVTERGWRVFQRYLRIEEQYPGINGIGVIMQVDREALPAFLAQQRVTRPDFRVYPSHQHNELLPIVYVEPLAANNEAVGLDMAHESTRYDGAKRARRSGAAQITGPIVLVQDSGKTPGFLFFVPYYDDSPEAATLPRTERFLGLVYAPFVVENLMAGTLGQAQRLVSLRVRDGEQVLYDEAFSEKTVPTNPNLVQSAQLPIYGRTWTFDLMATPELIANHQTAEPFIILFGGIGIDLLLLTLFLLMARSNRRAREMAISMNAESRRRTLALERSNQELEKFAYVASHDLKAPLRAIDQLADIVIEDAADALPAESRADLELLKGRVGRMDRLLSGLLDYSRIGTGETETQELDVTRVVRDIVDLQGLDGQITVDFARPMGSIYAPRAVADVVFRNLIGNTVKHHDRDQVHIRIDYALGTRFDTLTYTDDGPGIPYEFRHKIFEMFQTLRPRDEVEGSGMGLALVRKALESVGGTIELLERSGRGASFQICWARPVDQRQAA